MEKPIDFWFRTGKAGGEPKPTEIALKTSMSLERSRKTQSVSEGAERDCDPIAEREMGPGGAYNISLPARRKSDEKQ